ncbi:START domain-containing protein [Simiduia curdlanivorans]|uniref:START domain-containing protein n=1 Tax=Simiduia curdlanivorans TaxID=1492769 RepID=A0ABV8V7C0_9GAMM|nr:START domain-containing protein [Simiduia curdlanivorans]MDN3640752.1 START domain-containing protein [Simiduia curdlanivorans]
MTRPSIRRLRPRLFCLVLLVITLSACATVSKDWQLQKEQGELKYYTRMGPVASLPEFRATVEVDAPVDKVMNFLMDFGRHAEWVHGCVQSSVIAMDDFSTAYIYQVTKLPVVSGRDMIMLAKITRDDQSKQVAINLTAMPSYCDNNPDGHCAQTQNTRYVRVERATGTFLLTPRGAQTRIEWTQFIDPAGALPDWLVRANLSQVPVKSLRNLKEIMESGDS